ncbi:hypothetical protein [Sphingosinicella sp.]|uniref:S10 family serine carboxypeptidase-like protein n=1 Tax=Sphingosinicella sp. TaxID=1917971 RepID=UPI0035AE7549
MLRLLSPYVISLLIAVSGGAASAKPEDDIRAAIAPHGNEIVSTRHKVRLGNGMPISYTAHAGQIPLYVNDTGERMATMFFVAYIADRPKGSPPRPLTFLWNGGPGSNSAQVHIVGFGPKRVITGDTYPEFGAHTETAIVDHAETWLDSSDLVFVDPIGTGFSRATTQDFRDTLYTARGDAEAVAEFIRVFLHRFERWNSPLLLAGESYGTTRAELVADMLERRRTHVAGVLLISGFMELGQKTPPHLEKAMDVVEFAAAAHFHGKMGPDLQALSQQEALSKAEAWARASYAPALARLNTLSSTERAAILERLASITGLDPKHIDSKTLTIGSDDFHDNLLAERGLELGRYDSRMAVKKRAPGEHWMPWKDPSLAPMADLMEGTSRIFNTYIRDDLGFRSDLLYRGPFGKAFHPAPLQVEPQFGYAKDWMALMFKFGEAGHAPPADLPLLRAMRENPEMRVFSMLGLYDGTCAGREEAIRSLSVEIRNRVQSACYVGGHMFYSDRETRRRAQADFADFVEKVSVGKTAGGR